MMEIIRQELVIIVLMVSSESAYKPCGLKKNEVMVSNNERKLVIVYMQTALKVPWTFFYTAVLASFTYVDYFRGYNLHEPCVHLYFIFMFYLKPSVVLYIHVFYCYSLLHIL
jgi:hypothetical protein